MGCQYSKRYSEEFKRDVIALARSSDKTITEVARDLGVSPESLRGWVKRDRVDQGGGTSGELTSAEREELKRLRGQNTEQQKTIEILKKRRPSSPRTAIGERGLPVHRCGEGRPPGGSAVPCPGRGPLLVLRLAGGGGGQAGPDSGG